MKLAQKVAIAIDLNHDTPEVFQLLKDLSFLNESEVHLVHLYLSATYTVGLGEAAILFPMEEDRESLEKSAISQLHKVGKDLFPNGLKNKLIADCIFTEDPKRTFCDYVKNNKIDLVIVASREKRGFFESSFAQYVSKHSDAHMLMLKYKDRENL